MLYTATLGTVGLAIWQLKRKILSFDLDWLPMSTCLTVGLLEKYQVRATFFATHTPLPFDLRVSRMRLPTSEFRQGKWKI